MLNFLARRRGLLFGGGLLLLAFGILSWGRSDDDTVGHSVGILGAPLQSAARGIADGLGDVAGRYVFLAGARQESERLRQEVAELKRELLAVQEIALENERLKALLGFRDATDLPLVPARVIGRSATTWFQSIVLDKGTADGVYPDCAVLNPAGVVGRIYETSDRSSRVLLLTDPNCAVDAIVEPTRAPVVVEGQLSTTCRVLYLARPDEAIAGDRVVTSGLGGIFPKGLLLGEIVRVDVRPGAFFHTAELAPSVDFSRLEEVFVARRGGTGTP